MNNPIATHGPYPSAIKGSAYAFVVVIALALRLGSEATANVSYLVLAAYALLGRAHIIRAMVLCWLFTMLSPGVGPEASMASIGRYAVFCSAAVSAMIHSKVFSRRPEMRIFTLSTLLLGLFIMGHSLMVSPMADVSVLKALSWTLVMATLVSAWYGLTMAQREHLARQLFWFLVAILIISLPLVALPLGYLRNGTGFQGILNHPQALGPTIALLGAWTTSRLFGEPRPSWLLVVLTGACFVMVLMTEARTAGVALVMGVGLSVVVVPGMAGQSISRVAPGLRSARIWVVLGAVLLGGMLMAPTFVGTVQHYMTKSGRSGADGFLDAYSLSRGQVIDVMMANIMKHPFAGIGFGVASEPATMVVRRDPILGLPVGAAVEKGVAPLAVLEELGVIGAAFVALWMLRLLRKSSCGGLVPFSVCLTALFLNLGESTFFSPGGMGLLPLILLAWAYASCKTMAKPRHV